MKTRIIFPIAVFLSLFVISSCRTRVHTQTVVRTTNSTPTKAVTVEALSDEVSYNLDLRAVATVFADSRNLEDFENRLNDYNSGISNLDLNRDGYVDYLRVIEMYENNTRLVVVQSVLGQNVFQDVATIVVEGRNSNNVHVQIIGDPFIYGRNYIIQPVFYRTPVIFNTFWAPSYAVWRSPYYWGYYPGYWHRRAPVVTNVYVTNVHVHVNANNRYNYTSNVRNQQTVNRMQTSVSRSDYARSNPNQAFSSRNANVSNTREMQTRDAARSSSATTNSSRSSSTTTNSSRQTTTQPNSSSSSTRSGSATTNSSTRQTTTQPSSSNNSNSRNNSTTTQPSSSSSTRSSGISTSSGTSTSSRSSNSSGTVNSSSSSSRNNSSSSTSTTRSSGSSSSNSSNSNSRR